MFTVFALFVLTVAGLGIIVFGSIGAWLKRAGAILFVSVVAASLTTRVEFVRRTWPWFVVIALAFSSGVFWRLVFRAFKSVLLLRAERAKRVAEARRTQRLQASAPPPPADGPSAGEHAEPVNGNSTPWVQP